MTDVSLPRLAAAAALAAAVLAAAPAPAAECLADAFQRGAADLDARYRFEYVDEAGFARDARASTVRLRLGYATEPYHGFSGRLEFEGVAVVGPERYNSTANGLARFPVVADPEDAEINQGFLAYAGPPGTTARLGRQRIALDNHRHVGNVGWRQNEQTFDAVSIKTGGERAAWFYARLENANRVFGEHHPAPGRADLRLASDLVNVAVGLPLGRLVGYGYFLDFPETPAASHRSLGARVAGERDVAGGARLLWVAEFADQADYRSGDRGNDAEYRFAELGVRVRGVTARFGYESLGGDGRYAFQTPLATLHAHNGWTDRFLVTPARGLRDAYGSVSARAAGFDLLAAYHDFGATAGTAHYGVELGFQAERALGRIYSLGLKVARYEAGTFGADATKLWLALGLRA